MTLLLTELATRLNFCADSSPRRTRFSTASAELVPGPDDDPGFQDDLGEDLRPVELDELRSLRPALIGDEIQPEALGRPDEHQHDAGVDGADEGVLRRQDARFAVRSRRRGKVHLRPVAELQVTPMAARPGH